MKKIRAALNGNPDATMKEARETLRQARKEAEGQGLGLQARQAAEKVWLAASTAADAMVGPTEKSAQVFKAFERAWGAEGRQVAEEIETVLHRGCFYSNGPVCRGPFVDKYAERLGRLFRKPIRDQKIRKRLARSR